MISVWTLWIQLFTNSEKRPKIFLGAQNGRNRSYRNFYIPENDLFGVLCPKNFWPAPKEFQSPHKMIFMSIEPFWGPGGHSKSKNADNRPKNAIFQKFRHPQNRPFWGGVAENFSARTKGVPKHSEKFFGDSQSILSLYRLARAKNR